MRLEDAKTEIELLQKKGDPADRPRLDALRNHVGNVEQRDRLSAVATLDQAGVTRRLKELQQTDQALTPVERASFRSRHEAEVEALGRRVVELEARATPAATHDAAIAQRRTEILLEHQRLSSENPIAAAHLRMRNEWAFEPEASGR